MKNRSIVFTLALGIGLFLSGCSSDNNGGSTLAPLTGKWNFSKIGTTIAGQEVLTDPPQNESGCYKDYLEFHSDNTVTAGNYDSGSSPCALTTQSGTYVRTDNHITTVIDGTNVSEEILNLTLTELKVKDTSGAIAVFVRG